MGVTVAAAGAAGITEPSYKVSDVGVIPNDWDVIPMSELLDFRNGVNAEKSAYGHGIRFINVLEVITKSHLRARDVPGRVALSRAAVRAYVVRRGDILFNRTSETQEEVGLAAVYDDEEPLVFGGFVIRGRPITSRLDVDYSGYGLRSAVVRDQIIQRGQGAIRANIGQGDLRQVLVPMPSIIEQRAIAAALKDVDKLLLATDRLIEKKRAMKVGAMQQLLSGRRRLFSFTDDWTYRRIGEFTDCVAGGTPDTTVARYWGGEILWMSSGELNHKLVSDVSGRITPTGLQNSSARMVPAKSILIGLAGQGKTRGTVAMNLVPVATNQSIVAILPSDGFIPEYLYFNLDSRYEEIRAMSTGAAGRGGLNLSIIRSIEVPLPRKVEQAAIADVLVALDQEIRAQAARRAKIAAIRDGMLQELLRGRVRLPTQKVLPL